MKTLIALVAASLIMNVVTLGVVVNSAVNNVNIGQTEEQRIHEEAVMLYNLKDCGHHYEVWADSIPELSFYESIKIIEHCIKANK